MATSLWGLRTRKPAAFITLSALLFIASFVTQSLAQTPGLVAAYSFNEGSGTTVTDLSGNHLNGTILGAAWTTQGKYSGALSFNGISNYVDLGNPAALQLTGSMTLEAWVKAAANPADDGQIVAKSDNAAGWQLKTSPDTGPETFGVAISSSATSGHVQRYSTTVRSLNTWYHIAGVYDATGRTVSTYVNGILDNGVVRGGPAIPASQFNQNVNVNIGRRTGGFYFNGVIDEVRIYNRALSAAEIQADMNTPIGGAAAADTQPPTAPGSLAATAASSSQVNLNWTASTDNVGVAGYRVERCQGAGCSTFTQIATATGTTFGDTGMSASTSYSYRVRAADAAGNLSSYSNVAGASTPATATPGTLTANPTSQNFGTVTVSSTRTLSQTVTNTGGSSATISQAGVSGTRFSISGITPPVTLTPGQSQTFSVSFTPQSSGTATGAITITSNASNPSLSIALNGSGTSSTGVPAGPVASYSFSEGTGTTTADASGNNNNGTLSSGVTWTSGRIGNAVAFNGTAGDITVNDAASLDLTGSFTLSAWVKPNTLSGYRTIMIKESASSSSACAYYLQTTGNQVDAGFNAGSGCIGHPTSTANLVVGNWYHLVAVLDHTANAFTIYVNGSVVLNRAESRVPIANTRPLVIGRSVRTLNCCKRWNGVIDEVNVYPRALSAAEVQQLYGVGTAADTQPPTAPASLTATAASGSQINLSWTTSADNVGVAGYRVERCQGAGCTSFTQIATPTSTSYGDSGLSSGVTYTYRVRAADAAGNLSSYSATASATTPSPDVQPPTAPTNLSATAVSSSQVNLTWTASSDNVGVAGYRVFRSGMQVADVAATAYSDTGLLASTAYIYNVEAYDVAGNVSVLSQSATVTTPAGSGTPRPVYPVKASGRYLVDQNNVPFLITGDSPQPMFTNLSLADANTYLADRAAHGFNFIWVDVLANNYVRNYNPNGQNGATYDGITPFTNANDISTPNEAYFSRVDQMINLAASHGITVLLDSFETAGWMTFLRAQGNTKAFNWGVYLGNRYKSFPNIVWITGNDFQTWNTSTTDNTLVQNIMAGIASVDSNHLHTLELNYDISGSLDDALLAPYVTLAGAYTYAPTYDEVLIQYNKSNSSVPVMLQEAHYENETVGGCCGESGTPNILRRQGYWSLLAGALAGQMYGNFYTDGFPSGWQNNIDTVGVTQLGYWKTFFTSLPWYNLVPDQTHSVVTAGYGTCDGLGSLGGNDCVTTARTLDGKLILAYTPVNHTLTVAMTQLSGTATARWFDPSNGTYSAISGSPFANSGSRTFTSPGTNSAGDRDWVLVLEAAP